MNNIEVYAADIAEYKAQNKFIIIDIIYGDINILL